MAAFPFVTAVGIMIISTFSYLLFAFRDHKRRRGLPYPPGPRPWPIIGNLLDSPKQSQWTAYTELSKEHGLGDVITGYCTPLTETSSHFHQATFCPFKFLGKLSWCSVPCPRSKTYLKSVGKSTRIVLLGRCIKCAQNPCLPALLPLLNVSPH